MGYITNATGSNDEPATILPHSARPKKNKNKSIVIHFMPILPYDSEDNDSDYIKNFRSIKILVDDALWQICFINNSLVELNPT